VLYQLGRAFFDHRGMLKGRTKIGIIVKSLEKEPLNQTNLNPEESDKARQNIKYIKEELQALKKIEEKFQTQIIMINIKKTFLKLEG